MSAEDGEATESVALPLEPSVDISCTGTSSTFFDPGLLLTPRETEISWVNSYAACLPNSSNINVGVTSGSVVGEASCLLLLGSEQAGSQRIDWDTGEYTVFSWTEEGVTVTGGLGTQIYTVEAVVTDGLFLGSTVTEVITLTSPSPLSCLGEPGLTGNGGVVQIVIHSLT